MRAEFQMLEGGDVSAKASPAQFIDEFLSTLNRMASSVSGESVPDEDDDARIECLTKMVARLKTTFCRSSADGSNGDPSRLQQQQKEEEQKQRAEEWERALLAECQPISLALLRSLIQATSAVLRLLALKAILVLSHLSPFHHMLHQRLNVSVYVNRLVDLDRSVDESALALDYIRLLAQLHPTALEESHFYTLLAAVEDAQYQLNPLVLETLLELICKQPRIACKCQVFTELINYVVNVGTNNDFCIEVIMQVLLKCLDRPECRELVRFDDLLAILTAPFLDFHYVPHNADFTSHQAANNQSGFYGQPSSNNNYMRQKSNQAASTSDAEPKMNSVLMACSSALLTFLNSYVGIMCLSLNQSQLVSSLLTPFSWFLKSNLKGASGHSSFGLNPSSLATAGQHSHQQHHQQQQQQQHQPATKLTSQQLTLVRQTTILSALLDLLYTVFRVPAIHLRDLASQSTGEGSSSSTSQHSAFKFAPADADSLAECSLALDSDFVNGECESLLLPADSLISQVEETDTARECQEPSKDAAAVANTRISSGPNMALCLRSSLLALFVEAGLLEALLDLYFGLPLSFLPNTTETIQASVRGGTMSAHYQALSYKALHLFAELFYASSHTLANEHVIDSLHEWTNVVPGSSHSGQPHNGNFYKQGMYSEHKAAAVMAHIKSLDDQVREREVVTYLSELFQQRAIGRNGCSQLVDRISQLSFFAQQFLVNAAFNGFSGDRFADLELAHFYRGRSLSSHEQLANSNANPKDMSKAENREFKRLISDIERKFHAQIDATLVLATDSNISAYDPHYAACQPQVGRTSSCPDSCHAPNAHKAGHNSHCSFNWHEVVRLFETFLLCESSLHHAKFVASQETLFLRAHKYLLLGDAKFVKFIRKLFAFFVPDQEPAARFYPSDNVSLESSNLIACVGCYLLDFALSDLDVHSQLTRPSASPGTASLDLFHYALVEFMQNVKMHLSLEFFRSSSSPTTASTRPSSSSLPTPTASSETAARHITKDSVLSYYILFLGHLSSSNKGDRLLDSFKLYDLVAKIVEHSGDLVAIRLIVTTFNVYVSVKARSLLEKSLLVNPFASKGSQQRTSLAVESDETRQALFDFKTYILKLIRNMYRANSTKFHAFFVEILMNSIAAASHVISDLQTDNQSSAGLDDYNELCLLELTIDLVDYLLNVRPDLVDSYLEFGRFSRDKVEFLMRSVQIESKRKGRRRLERTRLVRTKLALLLNRFLVGRSCQEVTSLQRFGEMLDEWHGRRGDSKYCALLERNAFGASAVNASYMDEVDERNANRSGGVVPSVVTPFTKVYRRVNEPARNVSRYSAELAATYAPFHLHSALIRFAKFKENGFFATFQFEKKMLDYLREIRTSAGHTEFSVTAITRLKVKSLKCALWALCSMLNCEDGFTYLALLTSKLELPGELCTATDADIQTSDPRSSNTFKFVASVIKIAESYPLLSVRATAFLCLNYLSKTDTGVRLVGELGWLTFQPDFATYTRGFYATYGSLTSRELDLAHFYSHEDVAVALYNINRAKTNLQLKKIEQQVRLRTLCFEDKEFLDRKATVNVWPSVAAPQQNFVKAAFFHENICLPMLIHLMAPKDNSDFCPLIHRGDRNNAFIAYRYDRFPSKRRRFLN